MPQSADVVIVGAGIAGIAAAHELAVRRGLANIVIVDSRPPLTLTSDKSTECYRNFWPNRTMVVLMNRSIDLFEEMADESGNSFGLNRRGYVFATADTTRLQELTASAETSSRLGAGPLRTVSATGAPDNGPDGFELFTTGNALRQRFPFITEDAVGGLFVRRAGWLSAQQLGSWMLDRVKEHGGRLLVDEVTGIDVFDNHVVGVALDSGDRITAPTVVNAAGPLASNVAAMAGVELPVFSEVHLKTSFRDHLGVIPRDAPMFIWCDPQHIDWSPEETEALVEAGRPELTRELPIFCHGRPEGGTGSPYVLGLWEYHDDVREPEWPLPEDPLYTEVVVRGLATMVPAMTQYLDRLPESVVDGGYYTKTQDNRPLVGPAGPEGFHLQCAFSGFGVMVSAGAADLLGAHLTGSDLPEYAEDFLLSRYDNPSYLASLAQDTGQL